MTALAIFGGICLTIITILILLILPWGQWWCGITRGHEYKTQGSSFFWLTWTDQVCKHCGKVKG